MKKIITLLCGGFIALSLFVTTGHPVLAAQPVDLTFCGCGTPILGSEKDKIVAKLISSQDFIAHKQSIEDEGFIWKGVNNVAVIDLDGKTIVLVPFYTEDGTIEVAGFIKTLDSFIYGGHQPLPSNE